MKSQPSIRMYRSHRFERQDFWKLISVISILVAMLIATGSVGCSHIPVLPKAAPEVATCRNLDWYEIGRSDGAVGSKLEKTAEYVKRCEKTTHPFESEPYTNGRDAGLVEYCTATVGFETGRGGNTYDRVCPEHLEKSFLESYKVGQRVREIESENNDLQARIDNLVRLLSPNQTGGSVRAQIDQLRQRRVQNDTVIDSLETRAAPSESL